MTDYEIFAWIILLFGLVGTIACFVTLLSGLKK